jgi:hypothetical protein
LGYDSININGPGQSGRTYFGIKPSLTFEAPLSTELNSPLFLRFGYEFQWREYYNKDVTARDFDNIFAGLMHVPWSPLVSSDLLGIFRFFFKSGADTTGDSAFQFKGRPTVDFKPITPLRLKVGYDFLYVRGVDDILGPEYGMGPPDDVDDLSRGSLTPGATGFDTVWTSSAALYENVKQYLAYNTLVTGVAYQLAQSTTVGMDYEFMFSSVSNNPQNILTAHTLSPTLTQGLPWKGGSVSLINEIRFRTFENVYVAEGIPRQDFRNRLTLQMKQQITPRVGLEFFFRWYALGQNGDDYSDYTNRFHSYLGASFSY